MLALAGSGVPAFAQDDAPVGNGSIGDRVWFDADADGRQDDGEPGCGGLTVTLLADLDGDGRPETEIDNRTTNPSGAYRFGSLAAGTYAIGLRDRNEQCQRFTVANVGDDRRDSDIAPISGTTAAITLAVGARLTDLDIGLVGDADLVVPVSIGDRVWTDANGNGRQDLEEIGAPSVPVVLWVDADQDGTPDRAIQRVLTDDDGFYRFTGLAPDQVYVVQAEARPGFRFSPPTAAEERFDSDVDDRGVSDPIALAPGASRWSVDIGYVPEQVGPGAPDPGADGAGQDDEIATAAVPLPPTSPDDGFDLRILGVVLLVGLAVALTVGTRLVTSRPAPART